jgi:hypothetical protein
MIQWNKKYRGEETDGKKSCVSPIPDQSRSTDATTGESAQAHRQSLAASGVAPDLLRARLPNRAAEWAAHRPVRMVIITLMTSIIVTEGSEDEFARSLHSFLCVHEDAMFPNEPCLRLLALGECGRLTGV